MKFFSICLRETKSAPLLFSLNNNLGFLKQTMSEQFDPELWRFGVTIFSILIGLLIVSGTIVAVIYFKNAPQQASIESNKFLRSQSSIRILTVLVVVFATCVLSLFHALDDGVMAIFSGITGYVLGGIPAIKQSGNNDES